MRRADEGGGEDGQRDRAQAPEQAQGAAGVRLHQQDHSTTSSSTSCVILCHCHATCARHTRMRTSHPHAHVTPRAHATGAALQPLRHGRARPGKKNGCDDCLRRALDAGRLRTLQNTLAASWRIRVYSGYGTGYNEVQKYLLIGVVFKTVVVWIDATHAPWGRRLGGGLQWETRHPS